MYRMLSLLTVAVVISHWTAQSSATSISAPFFAFANEQYFGREDSSSQTSYRVHGDYQETLYKIVRGALAPSSVTSSSGLNSVVLQQHSPDALLIVLGSQLTTRNLRSKALHNTLQPLKSLLKEAKSSYSTPFMLHQVDIAPEVHELQELALGSAHTAVVGCSEQSYRSLDEAVQELGGGPAVVILCTQVDSSVAGSPAGIEEELQQLLQAHNAVAGRSKRQITMYASRPNSPHTLQQRRLMQAADGDVGVCGQLCQTQVKWLEGILAAFILAIAAFSGMCCLYMLDTPTRFEKPKEGARAD